jgi:citrate synthase
MIRHESGPSTAPSGSRAERASAAHARQTAWSTAITEVSPNRVNLRGYPVDEAMGRCSFAEAIYLLLVGELPTPAIGRLLEALFVSSIDHGATPPSTAAARHVATTGASLHASVAAGVLAFGKYHGGDIETCMLFLEAGVDRVRRGEWCDAAAKAIVAEQRERGEPVPGFGHRLHTHDPRAARLLQMALELELDGPYAQMVRAVERVVNEDRGADEPHIPINVDGAIAAVCGDLGLEPAIGSAMFIISRVPGLIAHAHEEQERQRRMRQIDVGCAQYDGPRERRLPENRNRG